MDNILKLRSDLVKKIDPKYGNYLFYLSLGIYLISQFFNGTMYVMYYPSESFPYHLWMLAGLLACVKILLCNKFKTFQDFIIFVTVGLLILIGAQASQSWDLLYYYLLIVAAQGIDFKMILKEFLLIISTGMVFTFVSAKLGLIMGLTNSRDGSAGIRYALGTVYPTDLAARMFYLMLAYALYKKFKFNLPEYISLVAVTAWTYIVTDTRLDLALMLLIIFLAITRKYIFKLLATLKESWVSLLSVLVIFGVIVMTYLYQAHALIFKLADKLLSGRLELGRVAFDRYNVTLAGQLVIQNGNGGIHVGPFDYFFIDCSFLRILMMNGLISFTLILIAIVYLTKRYFTQKTLVLEIGLLLVILSSLIDHHLLEISYNILFLSIFANLDHFVSSQNS